MNENEVQLIWQRVNQYRQNHGQRLNIENYRCFREVVDFVYGEGGISRIDSKLHMVVAMCWFGPQAAGAPPSIMRKDLWDILEEKFLGREREIPQDRIIEVTIAYGCGNWREVKEDREGWEGRWPRALDWMTHYVLGWLKATAAWLYFVIRLDGYAFVADFPSVKEAEELIWLLYSGKCDCYRLRFSDSDQALDFNAKRRAIRCLREHRLAAWSPAVTTLMYFLARAIKGSKARDDRSGRKGFVSGAVQQGMFFGDLYRNHGVRFGNILGWHCSHHPKSIFEGPQCLECRESGITTIFHERQHERKVVKRFVVKTPTGRYEEETYWRCQQCGNYYREHWKACPIHLHSRTNYANTSTVWVLGPPLRQAHIPPARVGRPLIPNTAAVDEHELWQALQKLSPLEQEAVKMKMDGMSEEEAAQAMGIPIEQLIGLLKHALKTLKQTLTQDN